MNDGFENMNRRKFLRHGTSVIAFGAAALALPAARAKEPKTVEDPMRVPGSMPRPE
jgi:hypothetical protein